MLDYEEFGVPVAGQADQRYGWLGGKQRSGDALDDVILMGVRLHNPHTGRFLSVDPVQGSANDYDYANQDLVNVTDLDGRCPVCAHPRRYRRSVGSPIRGETAGAARRGQDGCPEQADQEDRGSATGPFQGLVEQPQQQQQQVSGPQLGLSDQLHRFAGSRTGLHVRHHQCLAAPRSGQR
ncbi:RHS repeat-associated core domain-containing protein [Micromonospora sp. NPDC002717]|uniref:RHS repeat-associated core domain-containing protein n=1 Tax=Micromonospora sp. NPDC002717 TaxID=3154424 RepID=UPI00331695BA